MKHNVLVIGSGGREHAILSSLLRSTMVENIFIIKGNGGTHQISNRTFNVNEIQENEHEKILDFIQKNNINLTIIGPEAPLSEGIVDFLESHNQKVFGPTKAAAQIEASKIFMKDVLIKAGIPTAKYGVFYEDERENLLKK